MPTIELQVKGPLNRSLKAGDKAHFIKPNLLSGGFTTHTDSSEMKTIGDITKIHIVTQLSQSTPGVWSTYGSMSLMDAGNDLINNDYNIVISTDASSEIPAVNDFLFFSKSAEVNENNVTGYYGKFIFKNNSREKAELFSTSCEIVESSK
tara:strand:+ start:156 stop:605 length:450 start_codon:yes stop_codon:yes gene_type:complete